jgi:hypothetical protein
LENCTSKTGADRNQKKKGRSSHGVLADLVLCHNVENLIACLPILMRDGGVEPVHVGTVADASARFCFRSGFLHNLDKSRLGAGMREVDTQFWIEVGLESVGALR